MATKTRPWHPVARVADWPVARGRQKNTRPALRRTIGKVFLGTRVLSENGTRPNAVQIVARNVSRFLELLPPLWVLGFLVVLSRNRQRLGDIFARTVVVRGVKPAPKNPEAGD